MRISNSMPKNAQSLTLKLVVIALLALLMLIPANMVQSLMEERQMRRNQTQNEINKTLGGPQTLTGPVLIVPYRTFERAEEDELKTLWHHAYFLPEKLDINGSLKHLIRYRSIYKILGYNASLHIKGHFEAIAFPRSEISPKDVFWEKASFAVGISDMRGIQKNITLQWNEDTHRCGPGIPGKALFERGFSAPVTITPGKSFSFAFDLMLAGTGRLHVVPVGATTNVALQSDWHTPKFSGNFSPDNREIGEKGFQSRWKVLRLNRSYPQQWTDNQYQVQSSAFGVDFIFPVDIYQKNIRAVKYAILFIGLTFIFFFFVEQMQGQRIHPVNYLLVGFALIVFYSLLVALSEHLAFGVSYLVAAAAIVLLIASFLHRLIRKWKITFTAGILLTALYSFLYVILNLYAYSLLFGNIGLFVILAALMYFSGKIDWYRTKINEEKS